MKFAVCNEMFGDEPFAEAWTAARAMGYTGLEIAPFTLWKDSEPFDARAVPSFMRKHVVQVAADAGLEIIGLHWLLAKFILPVQTRRCGSELRNIFARLPSSVPSWAERLWC